MITPFLMICALFVFLVLANTIMGIFLWNYVKPRPVVMRAQTSFPWWVLPLAIYACVVILYGRAFRETD